MDDLTFGVPEAAADAKTLAAIDRGIKDADEGRTVSLDDAFKLIPQCISKWSRTVSSPS
jgi:predicted transcriptional regulator